MELPYCAQETIWSGEIFGKHHFLLLLKQTYMIRDILINENDTFRGSAGGY